MPKGPSFKDYAGNCYTRGKRRRTKFGSNDDHTFRCNDCGAMRHVNNRELHRAARPRCLRCGGCIVETKAEEKRAYGTKTDRRLKQLAIDRAQAKMICQCWSCGTRFETHEMLALHLAARSDCVQDYKLDRKTIGNWCEGTFYVIRRSSAKWALMGFNVVSANVQAVSFHPTRYMANEAMDALTSRTK